MCSKQTLFESLHILFYFVFYLILFCWRWLGRLVLDFLCVCVLNFWNDEDLYQDLLSWDEYVLKMTELWCRMLSNGLILCALPVGLINYAHSAKSHHVVPTWHGHGSSLFQIFIWHCLLNLFKFCNNFRLTTTFQ